jgi:SAM-dependent methyltransferase
MTVPGFEKSWEQAVQWLREQPDQREAVLAGYYDDPLAAAANRYWLSEEWRQIRQFLPHTIAAKALDIGAGRGIASFALAKDGFEVTALEPDRSELVGAGAIRKLAREQHLRIQIRDEVAEHLPFADASFDLAFGRAVLHHTENVAKTCREVYRVLTKGGTFIAVREHVISRDQDLQKFFELHALHRHYGGERAFRLGYYTEAIRSAGFTLERVLAPLRTPINFAPYSLSELQHELARRASFGIPALAAAWRGLLGTGFVWATLVPMLGAIDRRPGRLYSFIARKP